MHHKTTITNLIMEQAYDNLILAIEAYNENKISKEVQLSININLLLGVAMEGVINELSESVLDKWTYKELERSTTPLKWRIVSSLKPNGFTPGKEPLQTIINLHNLRNEIAHPKTKQQNNDLIISSSEILKRNPEDDYVLPEGDFEIYIGFDELHTKFNARNSFHNIKKAVTAVKEIKSLFDSKEIFTWVDSLENRLQKLKLN